ncbi:hypothetical protein HYX14_05440 [Candidatus Woesearchaeota archaeon]|nr:hypothetical protein [Candidatus Woesearchaeota archaeon]
MNLIVVEERQVRAKGCNPHNTIDQQKLRDYFFDEDYESLKLLDKVPPFKVPDNAVLFYPGCGSDIFFPLLYVEKLCSVKNIQFRFVDTEKVLGLIKTQLDDVGISFEEDKNKLQFYWKNMLITLEFIPGDVFGLIDALPPYDIYFERAFGIMKYDQGDYEEKIVQKLNHNGILISDCGYANCKLNRINVPPELSSYKEMIMGIKI